VPRPRTTLLLQSLYSRWLIDPLWIGLSQIRYVLPAVVVARVNGYRAFARGILIGAGITVPLNIAGYLLLALVWRGAR